MSALNLDSFALEMREHYIVTTLESLERFKSYDNFFTEVKLAIPDWVSEARSNEMNCFAGLLEDLKHIIETGSLNPEEHPAKVSKTLSEYLELLKTQNDSEVFYQKFNEAFHASLSESAQLYLQCISSDHNFIVPVKNVIEIIGNKKVFPLPLAQAGVGGLMSFRGQGIPVINLSDFGFVTQADYKNDKTFFVVCDFEDSFFALEVHSTEDVLEFEPSQFQNCSESSLFSPMVDHFVIKDNKSLMLLDIRKLVRHE